MQKVEDYLQNGKVYVWKETFAVAKAKSPVQDVFAAIYDKDGATIIIDQSKLDGSKDAFLEVDKDWRIITFDLLLPIDMVGFIAKISTTLAEAGVSILVVSSYSTDHFLVQDYDLAKAIKALENAGCRITRQ